MKVRDLMATKGRDVVSVESDSTVEDAIRSMNNRKISALIVTEQGKTLGIFTERDVVRAYISSNGKSFKEVGLKDSITLNPIVAEQDDDISDIMSIMVEKNIRHLPVVEKGKVIGMLSIRDIIQSQVGRLTAELHYLKDYISSY